VEVFIINQIPIIRSKYILCLSDWLHLLHVSTKHHISNYFSVTEFYIHQCNYLLNYLFVGESVPFCISCREIRNVGPSQANETGTFSHLSKSANMKLSRIELTSETLKKSDG
jgi:hypothetical protein